MTTAAFFQRSSRKRACVVILCILILHAAVIHWGRQHLATMNAPNTNVRIVPITLVEVPRPTAPVTLPVAPSTSLKKKIARSTASPRLPTAPVGQITETILQDAARVTTAEVMSDQPAATTNTPSADVGKQYHVSPPPSATVSYDVIAMQASLEYRALGKIVWRNDGQHYSIQGDATSLFITLLAFQSEGAITSYGLSPQQYTEQRFRRAATQSFFDASTAEIYFSSTTNRYPLHGGEQDRASLVWQLASIGRGDTGQFTPGAVIDIFVAGVKDGEVWRVQVIGEESLATAIGHLPTWHVVRQPKEGAYDQRIDIWLSPEHAWYPVKLRFTEPNDDYLDMSVTSIKLLQ
jgi:hypothetical protein